MKFTFFLLPLRRKCELQKTVWTLLVRLGEDPQKERAFARSVGRGLLKARSARARLRGRWQSLMA